MGYWSRVESIIYATLGDSIRDCALLHASTKLSLCPDNLTPLYDHNTAKHLTNCTIYPNAIMNGDDEKLLAAFDKRDEFLQAQNALLSCNLLEEPSMEQDAIEIENLRILNEIVSTRVLKRGNAVNQTLVVTVG